MCSVCVCGACARVLCFYIVIICVSLLMFSQGSKLLSTIPTTGSVDNRLPMTPEDVKLTPSPSSEHQMRNPEAVLSSELPLPLTKEEEGLSVGCVLSSQTSKPSAGTVQPDPSEKNDSYPVSKPETNMDNLVPVLDTSVQSGASSNAGSNVSLDILEMDATLASPKCAGKNGKSDNSSCSSSEEENEDLKEGSLNCQDVGGVSGDSGGGRGGGGSGMGGGGGGGGEMSWWADAVAETDNVVTEDLDVLVNRMERKGDASSRKSRQSGKGEEE